ncbi:uncharacterized protein LOC122393129 [Amphibalanus amphitrite]|uniref:uncharacterized protein LOC122393129 n=1 Tax=Amphibalanus amphitrite TaxID=1232801 RepID=UPI001C90B3DC|nr:uncharacterized protein LOC122368389 isoform X2 [Amphibalanus amphitrite]XP_043244735.1 uncharacterized protein LOC122393129 [Amphibalanus amphitrite]
MRVIAQIPHMHIYQNPDLSTVLPEPDYSDSEEEVRPVAGSPMTSDSALATRRPSAGPHCSMAGPQQQLHRELAFNQKIGKNLLGQKTELQKAMERHRDQQQRRQQQTSRHNNRSSFEMVMEQRLSRAEPRAAPAASSESTPEFLQVHARMRSKLNASS